MLLEVGDLVADLVAHARADRPRRRAAGARRDGIEIADGDDLDLDSRKELVELFEQRVFPVLTPLAVDPAHPFPYISTLSLNLAVMVSDPDDGERRFARVKVPSLLPRLVASSDGRRFVPLEQVIAAQLDLLFPGMHVEEHWTFRVTRNADLFSTRTSPTICSRPWRWSCADAGSAAPCGSKCSPAMPDEVLRLILEELDLDPDDVSVHRTMLDLTALFQIAGLDRPDLKDPVWNPVTPARVQPVLKSERSWFSILRERDLLVHHPYESFANTVESFIAAAADDPRVQSIKMTLYRMSDDSGIAAQPRSRPPSAGVQVAVLVELKARFDEQTNITWARSLERSGVHVMYGLVGLKTHSKCVLVVRDDDNGLRRYAHIGTGNYNSSTARIYEDLGLLTADPEIGADLGELFNHLTGYSKKGDIAG